MDPTLAELYGTNVADEGDVEKLAAAELAEQLSEEEGFNADGLDDDEVERLAQEVLNGETEEGEEGEELDEDSQEKLAEADYMGRVMAHAYVQELRGIDKEAGKATEAIKRVGKKVGKGIHTRAVRLGGKIMKHVRGGKGPTVTERMKKLTDPVEKSLGGEKRLAPGGQKAYEEAMGAVPSRSSVKGSVRRRMAALGYGTAGAGVLAAGGAGYAAKKKLEKRSSAFDTLAAARAEEILSENGYVPVEDESTKYDALAEMVEARAMEMAQEAISEE